MVPQVTCPPARQCWLRAWQRALYEKLVPYYLDGTRWAVKDYTVTVTGLGWSALACNCAAGRQGRVCKHAAVTAKAIALHVRPIKGTAKASQDVNHASHADLHPSVLVSGVAPQLAEMFA
jgi:hypothetical protein